jgi:hypothetical protein
MSRCQPIVQISQHTQWAHTSILAASHAGPSDSLGSNNSYTSWVDAGQSCKSHNTHNGPIRASCLQVMQAHSSISAAVLYVARFGRLAGIGPLSVWTAAAEIDGWACMTCRMLGKGQPYFIMGPCEHPPRLPQAFPNTIGPPDGLSCSSLHT